MSFIKRFIQEECERSEEFREAYENELIAEKKAAEVMTLLAKIRAQKKITQAEMARRLGISQPRVAQIEKLQSGVRATTMFKYAAAIGVSLKVAKD